MVGDLGLKALSDSDYIKKLEVLKLWKNEIGDESLELIVRSPNFKRVKTLMLNNNLITPVGAGDLANPETL
mgnify:CR=1 FL=1